MTRASKLGTVPAVVLVIATLGLSACGTGKPTATLSGVTTVRDPSALVNPFAGTGTGGTSPGSIGEFPGADVPFGMIQWSPDTYPNRISGSGYSYADDKISGFSLTHLSGDGCPAYGDVPILPTLGPVTPATDPDAATDGFGHAHESAAPGRYSVDLDSGTRVTLSVTTRTGIGQFEFPDTASANLLFKVAGSANPVSAAEVSVVGDDEVTGKVTSGGFCQTGTDYTLHFAALFDRSFVSSGTWSGAKVSPGSAACNGSSCGAYVTFDASKARSVVMKVGISFVSGADALANLAAEDPGWSVSHVEGAATAKWNSVLDRIRIGGGSRSEEAIFYTALYHSLLYPNVVSDADGQYVGPDHEIHRSAEPQYANFSEWDIYRSEVPLLAMIAPQQTGDMIQSLVDYAEQDGWLPKWEIVGGDAIQMNGDSADPIIADAYAFGVRNFDVKAALAYMVKGATESETGHGLEIERQYLDQYVSQHYVDAPSLDLSSINYSDGASVTLEYSIDDFAVAQLAQATGDAPVYDEMIRRAQNWEYLVNPAAGYLEGRNDDGSFPPGAAFQSDLFEPGGELGFEEGNSVQYTWSVPQDLRSLAALLGGDKVVVAELDRFFSHLNAGRYEPYDWSGNEPDLWAPWEYDFFGAPYETQETVRRIATSEYHDAPVDEPGNDDLGAMASWYVWAAIGLYPVTPGTADLELSSPLFPEVSITLGNGRTIRMSAPAVSAKRPYVQALRVTGVAVPSPACSTTAPAHGTSASAPNGSVVWIRPWLPSSVLTTGATLDFSLSADPDRSWAAEPALAPPSYTTGEAPGVAFTSPSGSLAVGDGSSAALELGLQQVDTGAAGTTWTATASRGVTVTPSRGAFPGARPPASAHPGGSAGQCATPLVQRERVTVEGRSPGRTAVTFHLTEKGVPLPPVVVDVTVREAP